MTAGEELAQARQRMGLSLEDLSTRTKIRAERLTAIEEMDASHLPGVFYVSGYVRSIAAEVGLDPMAATQRYIAEFREQSAVDAVGSDASDAVLMTRLAAAKASADGRALAQRAKPQPQENAPALVPGAARFSSRHIAFAALMVLSVIGLAAGFWALAARPRPAAVDGLDAEASEPARSIEARSKNTGPEVGTSLAPPRGDLSGRWLLTNRIEQSNMASFRDLTLGFRLQLDQSGNRVRGQGVKWTENGRPVSARARTPITVDGTIEGNRLALTFTERGARRTSRGSFDMQLARDGSLLGRFSSDAARSSGRARAVRAPQ